MDIELVNARFQDDHFSKLVLKPFERGKLECLNILHNIPNKRNGFYFFFEINKRALIISPGYI